MQARSARSEAKPGEAVGTAAPLRTRSDSSATAEAVEFALELRLDRVPQGARQAARDAILDALACALAAQNERVTRRVREWVADEGSRGACTVWGSGLRAAPARAALANGTSAHALDFDDVCWAMNGHPTVALLPALLAVAEARGASGADALAAYVAGFEVQARLGQALGQAHYARGWHPTATLGGIGATIAAGRLLELDAPALRRALGIACSTAAGSRMNFGTDTKPLHAGLAAQSGVVAAELAARGVTAREDGLEADMGLADLYDGARPLALPSFAGSLALERPGIELKPYPSCRFTHRLVDGVLALRARHPGALALRFELRLQPFAHEILIYPTPTTGLQAKFSAPYCAAVAWLDGWPRLESFSDARAGRADVQALLGAVEVGDAPDPDAEEIAVVLASGARDVERVRLPRGHPERPLSEAERLQKVRDCAEPLLGARGAAKLCDAVGRLEQLDDVRELTALLVPSGAAG